MNVSLTLHLERLVNEKVESGDVRRPDRGAGGRRVVQRRGARPSDRRQRHPDKQIVAVGPAFE